MDPDELRTTAHLARLELSQEEAEALERAVLQMLDYFATMNEIDVSGLLPTSQLAGRSRLRPDEAHPEADPGRLLEGASEREDRYIVIPNVL
jgi:aspartyl-tRNA(Asn)/glutamyl-tRNA(Gln) amidotransferase subunit C